MTACHKILFYTYQIVAIYSISDGRWLCDIQSWS